MTDETTIILELTPEEASVIHEMALTYAWDQGKFGPTVRNIYYALDSVYPEFSHVDTETLCQFSVLAPGVIWMDGDD